MATFSVADLTAKNKKAISKNDKKVIDKYKITSAYESKKGSNQKKKEAAKENKVETKAEQSEVKFEEKIEEKKAEENKVSSVVQEETNIKSSSNSTNVQTSTINIEETATTNTPQIAENHEIINDSTPTTEKDREEKHTPDNTNINQNTDPQTETKTETVVTPASEAVEKVEPENENIPERIKSHESLNTLPEKEKQDDCVAPDKVTEETAEKSATEFLYQEYSIDNVEFDVIESSYAESEMKEIMQTNANVTTLVDKNNDFMATSIEQDKVELDNITEKEENLAKSDNFESNSNAEIIEESTPKSTESINENEQITSEISLTDNSIYEQNQESTPLNNLVVKEQIVPENIASGEQLKNEKIEQSVESPKSDVEIKSETTIYNEIEDNSDEEDSSFIYGEADPSQFVYYHRKDIRLKFHTGEKRRQLLESIRANGIHEPILVRKGPNDKLEIIAGHNRQDIAKELGIKVPYILLQDVDDDTADQICVDTNLLNRQHNDMLPSELSNMLAVKRKMFTLERLSEEFHIANTTMKSFLKLQDLLPELLYDWVDTKKIGMTVGYTIACADRQQQHDLLNYLKEFNIKSISVKQGKEFSNRGKLPWDTEFLNKVFNNEIDFSNVKPQTKVSMTFKELGRFMEPAELKDPKRTLYNMLSLKKKADSMLAAYNMEYSEDVMLDALKQYIENNTSN